MLLSESIAHHSIESSVQLNQLSQLSQRREGVKHASSKVGDPLHSCNLSRLLDPSFGGGHSSFLIHLCRTFEKINSIG